MPFRCCIPKCRFDSDSKVPVFSFPKSPEMLRKWMSALEMDFVSTKNKRICGKHFMKKDISYESSFIHKRTGEIITRPLKRYRLESTAVPLKFSPCPDNLSVPSTSKENPDIKQSCLQDGTEKTVKSTGDGTEKTIPGSTEDSTEKTVEKSAEDGTENTIKRSSEHCTERTVKESSEACTENIVMNSTEWKRLRRKPQISLNFNELKNRLNDIKFDPSVWSVAVKTDMIMFLNLELNPFPSVKKCVMIDEAMMVTAYVNKIIIKKFEKMTFPFRAIGVQEISDILQKLELCNQVRIANSYDKLIDILLELKKHVSTDVQGTIDFLQQQVSLIKNHKNAYRYTTEMLIYSSILYSMSPGAYKYLRNEIHVILPHPTTIRSICSSFCINPIVKKRDEISLNYAKERFSSLNEKENVITLYMNEIHLTQYMYCKEENVNASNNRGGKVGDDHTSSSSGGEVANTAYVFMACSYLSSFREVVHILTVKKVVAETLFHYIKKIILGLEQIGYFIISVTANSNQINGKAMSFFAHPAQLSVEYPHPSDPTRPLFFIYDPIHVLKRVKNNWMNQKNDGQCIYYTNFDNPDIIDCASFELVKESHVLGDADVVQYACGLNLKSLCLTGMEKQNMKLVLQLFSEYAVQGLNTLYNDTNLARCRTTAEYVKILLTWWKIMNIKSLPEGDCKEDPYLHPITASENDSSYIFLQKFLRWVEIWNKGKTKQSIGFLSGEIFTALHHTTSAVLKLVKYCQEKLEFPYLFTGKM